VPDDRRHGVRSSTAPLRRALLSEPAGGDFAGAAWRGTPDVDELARQHAVFAELLAGLGVDVAVAPAEDGLVDACFAYDPILMTARGAVELRMAKPVRRREPARLAAALAGLGVPAAGRLAGDALADGGDMLWLDERTLAVARGYRTNAAAHEQLAALLAEEGATVERFDLPHHGGPERLLHLMSVVSPLAGDLALVFEPLAPVPLLEALDERGIRRLHCEADELDAQGCNALAVRPGVVVLADTCPRTRRTLERAGCEVHVYPAGELNRGEGGPTCLTQPVLRG
jgi:N-dimethylarginine dimethylaminohydrolase